MSISILIDDSLSGLTYGPANWSTSPDVKWVGGTSIWPQFADNGSSNLTGFLNLTFHGTSISFVGNTPSILNSQTAFVSIDGAPRYEVAYSDPTPQSYRQWYQSPALPDGEHTISIDSIDGTSVDYMVVTAGEGTPLAGRTVVVDDSDTAVIYGGQGWMQNDSMFIGPEDSINGMPFGNSTHRSSEPGDIAMFRFTGTSVSVYGIFIRTLVGSIYVMYTVDGVALLHPITYSAAPVTPSPGQQPNFLLFNSGALDPGSHTLVVKITQCANQVLVLDYFTYNASFASLEAMPGFAPLLHSAPAQGGGVGVPVGAIVGVVMGAVVLVGAVFLCGFCMRRRMRTRMPHITEYKVEAAAPSSDAPYTHAFSLHRPAHNAIPHGKQRPGRQQPELQTSVQHAGGSGSGHNTSAFQTKDREGAHVAELTREDHGSALPPPAYDGP